MSIGSIDSRESKRLLAFGFSRVFYNWNTSYASGAVGLMDSIRTNEDYTDVPWLLAFTSNGQYLEWYLWPDEMNRLLAWEEDSDRADVTDVKLHEALSCIAKAENEDAAVVLN